MADTKGNGPPADVPASELWTLLEQMPRPSEVVDFPRKMPGSDEAVGQLRIWVLTQQEQMACAVEAERFSKGLLKEKQGAGEENIGYADLYKNEVTVQVLARACRDMNDVERPAFPSSKKLRQLSVDEIGVLARHYLQVQAKLGPIVAYMTPEEEKAWIARLAEAGSVLPLGSVSRDQLEALMLFSACQLHAYWMATSSAGSQDAASSNDTATSDDA